MRYLRIDLTRSAARGAEGRVLCLSVLAIVLVVGQLTGVRPSAALGRPTTAPSDPDREYWQNAVVLFGDEATTEWSLRVATDQIKERTNFALDEFWMLNPTTRQWTLLGKSNEHHTLVPAAERKQEPDEDDHQLAADLDLLQKGMFGVFYAKWTVDAHVHGATFVRVGPSAAKRPIGNRARAPSGFMWTVVPLNLNKAEEMLIPDPRVACVEGYKPTSQPAP